MKFTFLILANPLLVCLTYRGPESCCALRWVVMLILKSAHYTLVCLPCLSVCLVSGECRSCSDQCVHRVSPQQPVQIAKKTFRSNARLCSSYFRYACFCLPVVHPLPTRQLSISAACFLESSLFQWPGVFKVQSSYLTSPLTCPAPSTCSQTLVERSTGTTVSNSGFIFLIAAVNFCLAVALRQWSNMCLDIARWWIYHVMSCLSTKFDSLCTH